MVEHIHGIVLAGGHRHRHAGNALEILVTLVEKTPPLLVYALPLVDGAWITQLLRSAAEMMDDGKFTLFLRLSARRKEEEATSDVKSPTDPTKDTTIPPPHEGNAPPKTPVTVDILFTKIMRSVRTCTQKKGGWHDEAVYGGLIAMEDIPGLGTCPPI